MSSSVCLDHVSLGLRAVIVTTLNVADVTVRSTGLSATFPGVVERIVTKLDVLTRLSPRWGWECDFSTCGRCDRPLGWCRDQHSVVDLLAPGSLTMSVVGCPLSALGCPVTRVGCPIVRSRGSAVLMSGREARLSRCPVSGAGCPVVQSQGLLSCPVSGSAVRSRVRLSRPVGPAAVVPWCAVCECVGLHLCSPAAGLVKLLSAQYNVLLTTPPACRWVSGAGVGRWWWRRGGLAV